MSLRVPPEMMAELDAAALARGQTRNAMVLGFIRDGLDGRKAPAPAKPAALPDVRSKAPMPPTKPGRMTMDDVRPKFTSRLKPEKGKR